MIFLLASNNSHKKKEFTDLFFPHTVLIPADLGIEFDCAEDGNTFEENARIKARSLFRLTADSRKLYLGTPLKDIPVFADDSGLLVDALPGELGVHTARFGSPDNGKTILPAAEKNNLLISRLNSPEITDRSARFVCVLFMILPDGKEISAEGISKGRILTQPDGTEGFGYDPVFFNNEAGCSNAALGLKKNEYSHRGKATRLLLEKLKALS